MKPVQVFLLGIAAVGFGLCVFFVAGRPQSVPKDLADAASLPSSRGDERPRAEVAREPGRREVVFEEVQALRQEVALLRAELAALKRQSAEKATVEPQAVDLRMDSNARAEAESLRQARFEALEAAFRQEPREPRWAESTRSTIQDALGRVNIAESSLRGLECRSHTCRVELAHDGSSDLGKTLPMFANRVGSVLPSLTAQPVFQGTGGPTTVLFLSTGP